MPCRQAILTLLKQETNMGKYFNKQKDEEVKETYKFPEYSNEELKEMEGELESYKVTRNIQGKDYTFYDEERYLKDKGALNKYGAVILNGVPILYKVLRDKFQQLYKLIGKREHFQKINSTELAESIKIINETEVDVF